jgi:hypothetical protein
MPFHFETITAGSKTLDVFGGLHVSPGTEMTAARFVTRSRVIDIEPPPRPASYPAGAPWPDVC